MLRGFGHDVDFVINMLVAGFGDDFDGVVFVGTDVGAVVALGVAASADFFFL